MFMPKVSRRDITWYMQNPTTVRVPSYRVLYWIFQTTRDTRVWSFLSCDWPVYLKFHNSASFGPTSKAGRILVLRQTPTPSRQDKDNLPWDKDSAWSLLLDSWLPPQFCFFFLRSSFGTCPMFCFSSSTVFFRTVEIKWSALRCSLWEGKIQSLEWLH